MKKKISMLTMVLIMVVSSVTVNAAGATTVTETDPHIVNIKSISNQYFVEDHEYTIEIVVENYDVFNWRDMYFKLDFGDAPIYVLDSNDGYYLDEFSLNHEYTLTYHVYVGEDSAGDYKASLIVNGTSYILAEMDITKDIVFQVDAMESNVNFYGEVVGDEPLYIDETTMIDLELVHDDYILNPTVSVEALDDNMTIKGDTVFENVEFKDNKLVLPLEIKVGGTLTEGFYNLQVDVSYKYDAYPGKTLTESFTVPVEVLIDDDNEEDYNVTLSPISVSDSSLNVGETSTLTTSVTNESSEALDEIVVSLDYDQALVPYSQDTIILHDVAVGESRDVSFVVEATDDAETRNYSLGISVEYQDTETKEYAGLNVYNDDEDETTSKPKLMVTTYSIGTDKLYAGDSFDLDFTLVNTNKDKSIKNIKVTVEEVTTSATSKVFMPFGTGSSSFIDDLGPKEESQVNLSYRVLDQAEGEVYSLQVSYGYEDVDGNTYEDSEILSIPVYQEPELTISDVRYGSVLDNGFTLEADFYNTGKIDIDNLMVDIEVDGYSTSNSNYYVGTFEAGRTDVYDVDIMGSQPDSISGKLIFTYDDTFGKSVEVVKEFTIGDSSSSSETGTVPSRTGNEAVGAGAGRGQMTLPDGMTQEDVRQAIQSGDMTMEEIQAMASSEKDTSNNSFAGSKMIPYMAGGAGLIALAGLTFIIKKRKRKVD